jgi:tRNA threonylcarbamoyladenosine biosynthesis protein TsaB
VQRGRGDNVIVLAIESATIGVGAAVVNENGPLAFRNVESGRLQTETLHPLIADVVKESRIEMAELGAIVVDVGPGLFTGLRVGVTTAKTLAFALGIPVIAITSTAALLAGAANAERRCVAVIDMRRSEVAYALDSEPDVPHLCTPDECVAVLSQLDAIDGAHIVGDGVERYREKFAGVIDRRTLVVDESSRFVDARVLGACAFSTNRQGGDPQEIVPLYIREPDAKINWSSRDLSQVIRP